MSTLFVALLSFFGFILAYHTYGRWIARKIFGLDPDADVPSQTLRDDVDYVPTKKEVIFGHHFTSIAGTGPIVGPAIAVFWGWLPALLWVVLGSIFIGAVHDFGSLVVSLRNRGQTVGEVAGRMITPRAKILFLIILAAALTIVLGIFGLVIAIIFAHYPESVLSIWVEIPLAVAIGFWAYKKDRSLLVPSLLALGAMYLAIAAGAYLLPINLATLLGVKTVGNTFANAVVIWTAILFVYCFVASVLPVWTLLQPRDYINSHQLVVALLLLVAGMGVAGFAGTADLTSSAPAVAEEIPADAPPVWPFLFITIACGAVSGFHCLVSSGTTSKQVEKETDAQYIGYGAMLLEGALAVVVIMACCAGVGMGIFDRVQTADGYAYEQRVDEEGAAVAGLAAWRTRYQPVARTVTVAGGKTKSVGGWSNHSLTQKVGAFVEGGANFLGALGLPLKLAIGIMAVLVASFAATTLDTATRLQRYVIQELSESAGFAPLTNKYAATALALLLGGSIALISGPVGPGSGGMILWPLFGATNQLLAGLAFMVVVFYLVRREKPIFFAAIPMVVMLIMPAWAMLWNMFNPETGWYQQGDWLLFSFGVGIFLIQIWMVVEGALTWRRARGNYPELPPLELVKAGAASETEGGRSC